PLDRRIHRAGLDDLIADEPALGAVALEPPLVLNRLARDTVAGEARQPHVGGPGNDTLLARRQRQKGAALSQHVIHHEKRLAVSADAEGLDGGNTRLLDAGAAELVGRRLVGLREPAIDLVHPAEVALQVPHEWNPAVIEVGEIDPGAEHPAA